MILSRHLVIIAVLLTAPFAASASFKVTAFEGGPGFKAIQQENYALALKRTRRSSAAPFTLGYEASGNHCVAQLFSLQPSLAMTSCNTAIRSLTNRSPTHYYRHTYLVDKNRSALYSNRGVAHAVSGSYEAAKSDFIRALALDPNNVQAADNLSHLLKVLYPK